MGTWRFTMPLLSTLAALVIIVNSAEENLDREQRYELRPRVLDMRSSEHEQPWGVMRAESVMQQGLPTETWNNESQDEPPIRRRVGRKRKRRPPSPSLDETDQTPAVLVPDRNLEIEVNDQNTEAPVKRRKKLRPHRWTDESTETARPLRRRGQRRKRPNLDSWPELSELGDYPRNEKVLEPNRETRTQTDADDDVENHRYSYRRFGNDDDEVKPIRKHKRRPAAKSRFVITDGEDKQQNYRQKEDTSFSEFSMEVTSQVKKSETDSDDYGFMELRDKIHDKPLEPQFQNIDNAKEHKPIDPSTLKDILKRSNGTSLSEILQQHNLSLADLLNGKENAISVLKSDKSLQNSPSLEETPINSDKNGEGDGKKEINPIQSEENFNNESATRQKIISTHQNEDTDDIFVTKENIISKDTLNSDLVTNEQNFLHQKEKQDEVSIDTDNIPEEIPIENSNLTTIPKIEERKSGMLAVRRFPGTIRRKLRMRPMVNNTYKSQINRDLIALSARRYVHHNRRNRTKAQQWRGMLPLMINLNDNTNMTEEVRQPKEVFLTTTFQPEETTTADELDERIEATVSDEPITISNVAYDENTNINPETTTISIEILATELEVNVTEKPAKTRSSVNPSGQRRQSLNHRLKKKRMKQRISTTEAPQDDIMKNLLELGDLVSSSEFIARTQLPKVTTSDHFVETATELEDFMTTQAVSKTSLRPPRLPTTRKTVKSTAVTKSPSISSTEESAKIEIEEILNDTRTSAKLTKILRERNMTLSELLEHRERGSSHVHLADIFHNASREPNPPEPFLSKSLIEPISKETYPLRALLDANLHDPPIKVTTDDSITSNHINIPVMMNFGSNVNENAENMGIMSLFNNFTKNIGVTNEGIEENITIQKDSKGTPYKSTVIAVNATDDDDSTRESRMLDEDQDIISWNEIFSMIRKNNENDTKVEEKIINEVSPTETYKKITLEEDVDGDGVIVLEDLQHFKDDNNVASDSDDKIVFNTLETAEILETGILNKAPNSAKSVTVATASIVGLAMILFLLTYAALKWRQQRTKTLSHKKKFCDDKIPSPVFENRKGTKNSSSRSISPMLPSSNIYTMNTLESQNGKDSPEYMWDSLRKPFQ